MPMRIIITVVANSNVPIFEGRVNTLLAEGWTPRYESFRINRKGKYYIILSNHERFRTEDGVEIIERNDLKE